MSSQYVEVIKSGGGNLDLKWREVWRYRDLLLLFVRRDFVAFYKQTVLGPLWFFIQPLLMTLTYVFIFGNVAGLSADGVPHTLFYLSGIVLWTYFADAVNQTSNTFTKNAQLFGKVYFPRIILPLSVVITNLVKMGIQLGLFLLFWLYFYSNGAEIQFTRFLFGLPLLILLMALLGLGIGLLVSALTTKYRDLQFLIQFSVQLLMYASTVIFPLSSLSGKFKVLILINPMSSIIETGRYMFFGSGAIPWVPLGYSALFSLMMFFTGVIVFNRTEKNFMDTV
jgi:lipopolysaccharide transport system permease protein